MSVQPIPGLERILFTEEQIQSEIRRVASEISSRYAGKTLKLIGVLKGSVFFLTALAQQLEIPVKLDFLAISQIAPHRSGAGGSPLFRNP